MRRTILFVAMLMLGVAVGCKKEADKKADKPAEQLADPAAEKVKVPAEEAPAPGLEKRPEGQDAPPVSPDQAGQGAEAQKQPGDPAAKAPDPSQTGADLGEEPKAETDVVEAEKGEPGSEGAVKVVEAAGEGTGTVKAGEGGENVVGGEGEAAAPAPEGQEEPQDENKFGAELELPAIMVTSDIVANPEHYSTFEKLQVRGEVIGVKENMLLVGTKTTEGYWVMAVRVVTGPTAKSFEPGQMVFFEGKLEKDPWTMAAVGAAEFKSELEIKAANDWTLNALGGRFEEIQEVQ